MNPDVRYIEHKPREHTDHATAWIARIWPSSSGKTLYFNDMALKRGCVVDGNHYDPVTGEVFWVSGVKKRGSNRHVAVGGGGSIHIEKSLVDWYDEHLEQRDICELIVIPDLPKPDKAKFNALENKKLA